MNSNIVKLKDICISMNQGINTSLKNIEFSSIGKPIIKASNISSEKINFENCKLVKQDVYDLYKEKYNPKVGDLVFCNIGSIGKVYAISQEIDFLITWNVFLIKVDKRMCVPKYLKWFLEYLNKTGRYYELIKGGTIKFISKKSIGNIEIPITDIERQNVIVGILDKYEEIIIKKKQQSKILDRLEQSEFYNLFNLYIKDKKYYKCIGEVIEIIDYRGKFQKKYDEGIRLINSKNIGLGYYKESYKAFIKTEEYESQMTRGYAKANDVIMTTEGGSVGNVARIPKHYTKFALGQRVVSMSSNEVLTSEYLEKYMISEIFQKEVKLKSIGSYAKGIRVSDIKKIKIPIPPMDVQKEYIKILNELEKNKIYIEKSIEELKVNLEQYMFRFFGV